MSTRHVGRLVSLLGHFRVGLGGLCSARPRAVTRRTTRRPTASTPRLSTPSAGARVRARAPPSRRTPGRKESPANLKRAPASATTAGSTLTVAAAPKLLAVLRGRCLRGRRLQQVRKSNPHGRWPARLHADDLLRPRLQLRKGRRWLRQCHRLRSHGLWRGRNLRRWRLRQVRWRRDAGRRDGVHPRHVRELRVQLRDGRRRLRGHHRPLRLLHGAARLRRRRQAQRLRKQRAVHGPLSTAGRL